MKQKVLPTIILLTILFIVFFIIYMRFYNDENKNISNQFKKYETVCGIYGKGEVMINSKKLSVDIADDNCKKDLGLSGKISLNEEGMIFVFEKAGNYGFWMKDMNFPIDILWIGDDFKIVGIEKDVSPDTYPKSFGKEYSARYVLELPALFSEKNNIKIGDKITFTEK